MKVAGAELEPELELRGGMLTVRVTAREGAGRPVVWSSTWQVMGSRVGAEVMVGWGCPRDAGWGVGGAEGGDGDALGG